MDTKTSKVNIGLVGLGVMGHNHLRVLKSMPEVAITFLVDPSAERCASAAKILRTTASYFDSTDKIPNKVLEGVDGVIIANPTSLHLDTIKLLIPYVRNLLVEKPHVSNPTEAHELEMLLSSTRCNTSVGYVERFNPAVNTVLEVLNSNGVSLQGVGNGFRLLEVRRTGPGSSRIVDVDVVIDLMVHDIDIACRIQGKASKVSAYGFAKSGQLDLVSADILHESGGVSRMLASRISNVRERRIVVTTEAHSIDADLLRREVIVNRGLTASEGNGSPYKLTSLLENVEVPQSEPLRVELTAFVEQCVSGYNGKLASIKESTEILEIATQISAIAKSNLAVNYSDPIWR
jgi:predicted dehydrogenase